MKLIKDYKDWVDGKDEGYNLRTTDRSNGGLRKFEVLNLLIAFLKGFS